MSVAMAARRGYTVVIPKGEGRTPPPPPSVPIVGQGRLRKIAFIGSASTVDYAPWHDSTWEIWSHAVVVGRCKRVDRLFEMHTPNCWRDRKKPQWPTYYEWLQRNRIPIYMQEKYPEIPAAIRWPRERLFAEFRRHAGNQVDYMIMLALSEGLTHAGFYGIHYVEEPERHTQLLTLKYWLGFLEGRGVQLVIPQGNPLFRDPVDLYGFESHNTDEKIERKVQEHQAVYRKMRGKGMVRQELKPFDFAKVSETSTLAKLQWGDTLGLGPAPEHWHQFTEQESHEPQGTR